MHHKSLKPIDKWLDFWARWGISDAVFDQTGCLALCIDGCYQLDCQLCAGRLILMARIGRIPASVARREVSLARILQLATVNAQTRYEIPVLDPTGDTLLLQRWFDHNVSFEEFNRSVELFLEAWSAWRDWWQGLVQDV